MLRLLGDVRADLGLTAGGALRLLGERFPATLAAPLAVADCAVASVAACLTAAVDLAEARTGRRPEILLDTGHVAAAVRGEAWLRDPAGRGVGGFAPLSRLWPAADGWVRTHANYPWHRAALLTALGVDDGPDDRVVPKVADAIARRAALDVERDGYAAGALAVAARTAEQWRNETAGDGGDRRQRARAAGGGLPHPGAAVDAEDPEPVVGLAPLGAGAQRLPPTTRGALPAAGVRVLDLTRVIAGPVGTRMLGALGADVLRIDDPNRPEPAAHAVDGVIGKASALLDVGTEPGQRTLHRLLDQADVLVTGYRPGALRRFGLDPDQMADRHPGTVVVTLSAWGTSGSWGTRRGFDSLVQIATGIGWATSPDGVRPGALPCQLLDHASGYLLAAGTLAALLQRERTGVASHVRVSLARTARWLLDQGGVPAGTTGVLAAGSVAGSLAGSVAGAAAAPAVDSDAARRWADAYRTDLGNGWTGISPPGRLDGRPLAWPHLPPAYGAAPPAWS